MIKMTLRTADDHYIAMLLGTFWKDYKETAFKINVSQELGFEKRKEVYTRQMSICVFSCALIESIINVFLSLSLTSETFAIYEKRSVIDKWFIIPSELDDIVKIRKGTRSHQLLKELTKYRNCILHNKPKIEIGENTHVGQRPNEIFSHAKIEEFVMLPINLLDELCEEYPQMNNDLVEIKKFITGNS